MHIYCDQNMAWSKVILLFGCVYLVASNPLDSNSLTGKTADATGTHWALIVAGSNGWYNYRHQADACHAYQIVRSHGIPADNIITMMYDDIANNPENPTPGIVINRPGGDDVYKGVQIDYKKEDVTPDVFLSVLQGNEQAVNGVGTGRVIKSGPNDRIFVNFVDHGAPGILAFPMDELHARDLIAAINSMHQAMKYKEMVFYVEACESGSMFSDILPDNVNVFATTAANAEESSYACYYDKERKTYLGDVYSVKWMEDSDIEDLNTETLQKQFMIVKKETNTSHVMEYGDMSISKEAVGNFQGDSGFTKPEPKVLPSVQLNAVASEQVPLAILSHQLAEATSPEEESRLLEQITAIKEMHKNVMDTVAAIVKTASRNDRQADRILGTRYKLTNFDCYEPVVELFDERCFDISQNDYAMRSLYKLVNLCEEQVAVETIMAAIATVCQK